jgi:hypothetical protein
MYVWSDTVAGAGAGAGAGLRSVTREVQQCGGVQRPFSAGEQSGKSGEKKAAGSYFTD